MMQKRMKILHVLTDRNIGGAGRWLLYYLKYHNRERFAVQVALPQDSLLVAAVRELDVPVIAMEELEDKSFDKKALKALTRMFRAEQPDIVHTHASMTARIAARRARVPYIINTKHCMEGAPGSLPKKILRREINAVFSDKIIAVSKAVRRSMIAGGTKPQEIAVIYNGIERIPIPTAEEKAALLSSFGGKAGETVKVRDGLYSLELWHGPTCAFKDYALQLMPKLLVEAKKMLGRTEPTRILVATSGDTGKAALAGYADLDGIEIEVFYPNDGTSEIQHLQMATQKGENVQVYAVQGNFDDAQTGVKKVFADADVAAELEKRGIRLSSANSINWEIGRASCRERV